MLVKLLIILTGLALISVLLFLLIRCQQRNQLAINVAHQLFLPLVSIIVATTSLFFSYTSIASVCPALIETLFWIGISISSCLFVLSMLLSIIAHILRNHLSPQPLLLSALLVTCIFLLRYLSNCL